MKLPTTIARLLDDRARMVGEAPAFIEGSSGRTLSWSDLAAEVERWRIAADRLDEDRGRVGLIVADPLAMVASCLGAMAAGVTVAPLNPAITFAELAAQGDVLGLAALVTDGDEDWARRAVGSSAIWTTGAAGLALPERADDRGPGVPRRAAGRRSPVPSEGEAALVLASSGTTGTPKIIPLTEANLLHTARSLVANHELTAHDRGYCPLPLFHINALVVGVLSTVVGGSSLVVDRRFSASGFWPTVARHGVTWLNLVPAIITVLAERPGPAPEVAERVGFARSASAPLSLATRERFERRSGVRVLETYGMTEAGSQIAANPRQLSARRDGSVGCPVGLDLRIVDGARHAVPAGVVGHVEIRGTNVVAQYWQPAGAPLPTRPAVDADGWLATGDLGRVDTDGFVYLIGRSDDVINRGGEKLYPREIEEVLLCDPAVSAAAVVGRPHPTVGEEPVAFVIAAPGCEDDEVNLAAQLAERCTERLSHFKRPANIIVAEQLPSGPTGKIRHSELRRAVAAEATA